MSTEIQTYQQPHASLPDKMAFAKALAAAGMIPKVYQSAPANVLVAIELGEALGIAPIVAINEINVINGTPAPSASLMASLARAAGHKVRIWSEDDGAGVCEVIRADDPEFTHRARWDEAKARAAGLWGRGHWSKDPATMLRWRAVSECVRLACSEVLGGLKYTDDEVRDFTPRGGASSDAPRQEPQQSKPLEVPDDKPQIPANTASAIADADSVEKVEKIAAWINRNFHGPDASELIAACADRAAELTPAPEPTDNEAQQTIETILEGEVVDA